MDSSGQLTPPTTSRGPVGAAVGDDVPLPPPVLQLAPFRAWRFDPRLVKNLAAATCPPYDLITDAEADVLMEGHPYCAVRLVLPRESTPGAGDRYDNAARTATAWKASGLLRRDDAPALYVYEISWEGGVEHGLVGALLLQPPAAGIVLPHENTMAGPVDDRLALTRATEANLEPIFLVHDGGDIVAGIVTAASGSPPLADIELGERPRGFRHRLWAVTDPTILTAIAAELAGERVVIADGHHRYATYLRYQAEQHAAGAGPGPWDFGLALLVSVRTGGPQVHAIHRVLPSLSLETAAQRASAGMRLTVLGPDLDSALGVLRASEGHAFLLVAGGRHVLLDQPDPVLLAQSLPQDRGEGWQKLDVTVAHHLLIRALLQLPDDEQTVDYRHDVAAAITAADAAGGVALLLNPTPLTAVTAVAAEGERMPRKSTLFTPKPRTGLLFRWLADD